MSKITWKLCAATAGQIVQTFFALTPEGCAEKTIDASLPLDERASCRWATFAANPSLDAWTDEWADSDGPRDLPPDEIEWRDVSPAEVARIERAVEVAS